MLKVIKFRVARCKTRAGAAPAEREQRRRQRGERERSAALPACEALERCPVPGLGDRFALAWHRQGSCW